MLFHWVGHFIPDFRVDLQCCERLTVCRAQIFHQLILEFWVQQFFGPLAVYKGRELFVNRQSRFICIEEIFCNFQQQWVIVVCLLVHRSLELSTWLVLGGVFGCCTDTRQAQVYGVLVCNLICSSFHRFSRQEKDRFSCSALSNEDFCRENTDINLLVSRKYFIHWR